MNVSKNEVLFWPMHATNTISKAALAATDIAKDAKEIMEVPHNCGGGGVTCNGGARSGGGSTGRSWPGSGLRSVCTGLFGGAPSLIPPEIWPVCRGPTVVPEFNGYWPELCPFPFPAFGLMGVTNAAPPFFTCIWLYPMLSNCKHLLL